jgi:hypothetical protein
MRALTRTAFALVAVSIAGCEQSGPVQPKLSAPTAHASHDASGTGKPDVDPTYANGETVYMLGPHMIVNARETQPNLYAKAEELYLLVYPQEVVPSFGALPITLPSGYQPQCNPCFHPGLPAPFVFHDHVVTGAPGMGKNGTAGEFKAPWKIILLMYNPAYMASPNFVPIKSAADVDAAEQAGNVFLPINQGGPNPYEIETGNVLICPMVSSKA